jgi:hypothetical protein
MALLEYLPVVLAVIAVAIRLTMFRQRSRAPQNKQ